MTRYTETQYNAMRAYYARPVPTMCSCRKAVTGRYGRVTRGYVCDYHVNAEHFAAIRAWELQITALVESSKETSVR